MKKYLDTAIVEDKYSAHSVPEPQMQSEILKLITNNHISFQNSPETDLINNLDEVFEAIVKVDEAGKIVKVNKTFIEIFGYNSEHITGMYKEKMLYPEDKYIFQEMLGAMLLNGIAKAKMRLIKQDGNICYGKLALLKCSDSSGKYTGYYSFMEDISEQVITEKSLFDAQNFLASTLNSLSENVAIIDENGTIIAVNRAWTAFALQNGGDLKKTGIGSNYLAVCENAIGNKSEEGKKTAAGIRRVLSGEISEFELKYPCNSLLKKRWFILKVTKFVGDGKGKAVILHADITKYEMAEIAMKKSEEKYRMLIQNASDIVTVLDRFGNAKFSSPSTERILGYKPEERKGRNVFELIHPDDVEKVKNILIENAGKPDKIIAVEYWIRKADGNYIYMESIANNVLHDPNVQGIVINSRDITDRKFAEEQTKAALEEKEVLLREIHHRVKNNLQIVTSLLKLQGNHVSDEGLKKIFDESIGRVKAMTLIHQGLYNENSLSHIDFGRYMRTLIEFLKEAYDAADRNIECEIITDKIGFNLETAVPCGLIVNELVSNSLKHAFPDGNGGKLIVKLETKGKHILTISDNGTGIPGNFIFNNAKTLGLSLINTLCQQLGAEIEIDNSCGTSFKITFEDLIYKERIL